MSAAASAGASANSDLSASSSARTAPSFVRFGSFSASYSTIAICWGELALNAATRASPAPSHIVHGANTYAPSAFLLGFAAKPAHAQHAARFAFPFRQHAHTRRATNKCTLAGGTRVGYSASAANAVAFASASRGARIASRSASIATRFASSICMPRSVIARHGSSSATSKSWTARRVTLHHAHYTL